MSAGKFSLRKSANGCVFLFFSDIVTSVWGWCMAIIRPGSPAPLPISNMFFANFVCGRISSQSITSKSFISDFVKRPTMLWALLNFKISSTKIVVSSFVLLWFLI